MRVLVPADCPPEALGELPDGVDVVPWPLDAPPDVPPAEVTALVLDPRYREALTGLLPALSGLRLVQTMNAGVDWVPPLPDGVTLARAGGVHEGPVAEWVLAAVLAMEKRLPHFLGEQDAGRWDSSANLAFAADGPAAGDLAASTAVVVGMGAIGTAVAQRLRAFGTTVHGVTRSGRDGTATPDALPRLLPDADVVVLLAPAGPDTAGLVDAAFLAAMRPGALLVNAARGSLVDTGALVDALRSGRVRAALDVTDPEPLPPGHPLWTCPGLLLTPHVAGSSPHWRQRAWRLAGEQLRRLAAGRPLEHVVARRPAPAPA
ncbi:MAG TPA: NAD(P)-dependent oxidoreductase [Geodermatophilus sp.]|nr:NAD(P)-dependent oxidoreductase [Geodermatophilus sp.]